MGKIKLTKDKKTLLCYESKCPEEIAIPENVEVIEKGVNNSFEEKFAEQAGIKFFSDALSADEQQALSKYTYHEVADGIALDDFEITDDMPTSQNVFGESYLVTLEIPNEINGKPVVELSADFHKSKKAVRGKVEYDNIAETLIIPGNLKRIRCSLSNRNIKNVVVSDKSSIVFDDFAWYEDGGETLCDKWINNSYNVREYKIREGAIRASTEMGPEFSLDKLFFPESFTEIYDGFLKKDYWSRVKKIYAYSTGCMKEYADKIGADFVALDAKELVVSEDGLTLISCPQLFEAKKFVVPDDIRYIEQYAFKGNETIEEIVIPDSVEVIGEGAFYSCEALETVVLQANIKELPDKLFAWCEKLSKVDLPDGITKIGVKSFFNTRLENIIVPSGVTEIGDYAFANNQYSHHRITYAELPESVRKIGISVFAGAKNITVYDSITPDAKAANEYYDDADGCWNSNVGCIGICLLEGYLNGACNSIVYQHTITVKSAVDDTVKYKVLMYGNEEPRNVYCAMVSSWGKNAEFNFVRIDEKFSKLTDADDRLKTVLNRLDYPVDLSDETKSRYISWLRRNVVNVFSEFIEDGDIESIINFEQYGIITKSNIKKLVELAISCRQTEIIAYLIEYSSRL